MTLNMYGTPLFNCVSRSRQVASPFVLGATFLLVCARRSGPRIPHIYGRRDEGSEAFGQAG